MTTTPTSVTRENLRTAVTRYRRGRSLGVYTPAVEEALNKIDQFLGFYEWSWVDLGVNRALRPIRQGVQTVFEPLVQFFTLVTEFLEILRGTLQLVETFLLGVADLIAAFLQGIILALREFVASLEASLSASIKVLYIPMVQPSRFATTGTELNPVDATRRKAFEKLRSSLIQRQVAYAQYMGMAQNEVFLSEEKQVESDTGVQNLSSGDVWDFAVGSRWEQWLRDFHDWGTQEYPSWNNPVAWAVESDPTRGGLERFRDLVLTSLDDREDSARPAYGEGTPVVGFCLVWGFTDVVELLRLLRDLATLGWPTDNSATSTIDLTPQEVRAVKIPGATPAEAWAKITWGWPRDQLGQTIETQENERMVQTITGVQVFRYRGDDHLDNLRADIEGYTRETGEVVPGLWCVHHKDLDLRDSLDLIWAKTFYTDDTAGVFAVATPEERTYRVDYAVRFRTKRTFRAADTGEVTREDEGYSGLSPAITLFPGSVVRTYSAGTPPDWMEVGGANFFIPGLTQFFREIDGLLTLLEGYIEASNLWIKGEIEAIARVVDHWLEWATRLSRMITQIVRLLSALGNLGASGFYFAGNQGVNTLRQAVLDATRLPPLNESGLNRMDWADPRLNPSSSSFDPSLGGPTRQEDYDRLSGQPTLYSRELVGGVVAVAGADAVDALIKLATALFGLRIPASGALLQVQNNVDALGEVGARIEDAWAQIETSYTGLFDPDMSVTGRVVPKQFVGEVGDPVYPSTGLPRVTRTFDAGMNPVDPEDGECAG